MALQKSQQQQPNLYSSKTLDDIPGLSSDIKRMYQMLKRMESCESVGSTISDFDITDEIEEEDEDDDDDDKTEVIDSDDDETIETGIIIYNYIIKISNHIYLIYLYILLLIPRNAYNI